MNKIINSLSKKEIRFINKTPFSETPIKISLPDMTECEVNTWGDWGEMHEVTLEPHNPVMVEFNGHSLPIEQKVLKFNSPIDAETRKNTPVYCRINVPSIDRIFYLYFNGRYEIKEVEVRRYEDNVRLQLSNDFQLSFAS